MRQKYGTTYLECAYQRMHVRLTSNTSNVENL